MRTILFTAAALLGLASGHASANVSARASGQAANVETHYGTAGRASSVRTGEGIASWSWTKFADADIRAHRGRLATYDRIAQADQTGTDSARRA